MQQNAPQNDFVKMQEQAIKRVREMQQKAAPSQPDLSNDNPQQQRTAAPRQTEPIQNNKPPEQEQKPSKEQHKREKPFYAENTSKETSHNPFADFLKADTDMSIILPLIFFLGKEGADDVLILALLYIMA